MRYMERGGFRNHPLMRLTLGLTLLFLAGLWATNLAMYFSRMGLGPGSVRAYYLGSEPEFRPPRTLGSMLETTHAHLPIFGVTILLVTHLLIFAPWPERIRRGLIYGTFLSALADEGSGWLVRFVHPSFAWAKVLSFAAFQVFLAAGLAGLAGFLWGARGRPSKGVA